MPCWHGGVARNPTTLDPNSYRIAIEKKLLNEDRPQVQGYRARTAEFPALEGWLALRVPPKDIEVPVGALQRSRGLFAQRLSYIGWHKVAPSKPHWDWQNLTSFISVR